MGLGLGLAYLLFSLSIGVGFLWVQARRRGKLPQKVAMDFDPKARAFEVEAEDGIRIRGVVAAGDPARPLLFFQHGKGGQREEYWDWARPFLQAGYGVVTFDWRSHGLSEGSIIAHGSKEPLDLSAVLAFVAGQEDLKGRPIGIYAASLGASSVAMAADRLGPEVKALVLDSPYGDLARMARVRLKVLGPLGFGPWISLEAFSKWAFGKKISKIQPEVALPAFAPRPILVMHGDDDKITDDSEGRSLYQKYPGQKAFWLTPEPGHLSHRRYRLREWTEKIAGFFARSLPKAPPAQAVLDAIDPEIYARVRKDFPGWEVGPKIPTDQPLKLVPPPPTLALKTQGASP